MFWLLFEDDDESFVVVGDDDDKGMLDFSILSCWLWIPKFGFNISDIKNDFIFDVWVLFNNVGEDGEDDDGEEEIDDDLEYIESGDDKNSWWSLAPMIKPYIFLFWQL